MLLYIHQVLGVLLRAGLTTRTRPVTSASPWRLGRTGNWRNGFTTTRAPSCPARAWLPETWLPLWRDGAPTPPLSSNSLRCVCVCVCVCDCVYGAGDRCSVGGLKLFCQIAICANHWCHPTTPTFTCFCVCRICPKA